MVFGAVASMVIGFSWGGWVTGETANKLAAEQPGIGIDFPLRRLSLDVVHHRFRHVFLAKLACQLG